jgi:hypothetical protein
MRYALLLLALGAAACTAPTQGALNSATAACSVGDRNACAQLPVLNAQVQSENQQNQVATGVAAGLGGAVGGAVIGGALADHGGYYHRGYYPNRYHRCWNCW